MELHEESIKCDFSSYFNKYRDCSQEDVLKQTLLKATDRSCDSTKGPGGILLVIKLVKSMNYKNTQVRKSI